MTKTIEQKFKKLTDVQHILLRPARYIGAIEPHESGEYLPDKGKMVKTPITYNPGFLKLFDEIISNSADHSKRPEGKHLDTIKVEVNQMLGSITVFDNGGIPVVKHREHDQWVPDMIFELRSGSNFDDSDETDLTGQNGEGAALSLIFSKEFEIETCDGKNLFKTAYMNNRSEQKPITVTKSKSPGYTKITYYPDFEKLKMHNLDDQNMQMLKLRTMQIAATNPNIKVFFNNEKLNISSFKDFVGQFTEEFAYDETPNWKIGVTSSDNGFEHISFVNSTATKTGGTHIDYVMNQIVGEVRDFVKKKHKIDVKPSDIKNQFFLFVDARIVNPRYASQTKDDLVTESRDYKTEWKINDKFLKKILGSSIVQNILDWAAAKAHQNEMAELRKLNKQSDKMNLKHIKKFYDATETDRSKTSLFLCEGDSAQNALKGTRNPKIHGVFPLRGRPINVSAAPLSKVKDNEEFENVRTILGLKYGEKADFDKMYFDKIIIASDADQFGHSIAGLSINMFYRLWPEIVESGKLYRLITPVVVVEYKKKKLKFFTEEEFEKWREEHQNEKYTYKFVKGLGSSSDELWEEYMGNLENYLVQFVLDKEGAKGLDLVFGKESGASDKRKEWLNIE